MERAGAGNAEKSSVALTSILTRDYECDLQKSRTTNIVANKNRIFHRTIIAPEVTTLTVRGGGMLSLRLVLDKRLLDHLQPKLLQQPLVHEVIGF